MKSEEFLIQQEREKTTLAMVVFGKQFLPDSASEPDAVSAEMEALRPPIKIIPLEDVNESDDSFNQSKSYEDASHVEAAVPQPLIPPVLPPPLMATTTPSIIAATTAPVTASIPPPIDTNLFSIVNPSSLSDEATEQIKQILKHIEKQQKPPVVEPQVSAVVDYSANTMQSEQVDSYDSYEPVNNNYRNEGGYKGNKWGSWNNNNKPYQQNRPNFNANNRNYNNNNNNMMMRKPGGGFQRHHHGFNQPNNGRNQFGPNNYRNNNNNNNNNHHLLLSLIFMCLFVLSVL